MRSNHIISLCSQFFLLLRFCLSTLFCFSLSIFTWYLTIIIFKETRRIHRRKLIFLSLLTDILYVASLYVDNSNNMESASLNLKCFCESFAGIFSDPDHLGDLPASNKPADGVGILINLTGKRRWRPFATWIIKLINKCLTDGTLYVEGLIDVSFVSAACSLLCYGDADLHMVGSNSYKFLLLV